MVYTLQLIEIAFLLLKMWDMYRYRYDGETVRLRIEELYHWL